MAEPRVQTLTILSGAADSGVLELADQGAKRVMAVWIFAPLTLPETITVEVAPRGSSVWRGLQSGGNDVTVVAGKVTAITQVASSRLRIHSSSNVGADRVFAIEAGALT